MTLPKNWKTTLAGILLILLQILKSSEDKTSISSVDSLGRITAAIGLLAAKDYDKTDA